MRRFGRSLSSGERIVRCVKAGIMGVALGVSAVGTGWSETIRVPGDHPSINGAIAAANAGDTVLVAAGEYSDYETRTTPLGNVSAVAFLKGDVTLLSESGPALTTLRLDSTVGFANVIWADYETGIIRLDGFGITSSLTGGVNGASFVFCDLTIIEDCVFRDMGTGQSGEGGLGVTNGDLEIRNCQFLNIDGGGGGGLGASNADFLVEDCHFENCSSGAMQVTEGLDTQPTTLVLRNSTFIGNTKSTGGGAGCSARCDAAVVEGCWFEGNQTIESGSSGGGLRLSSRASFWGDPVVRDNTFVGNSVSGNSTGGGALISGRWVEVRQNTFHGNSQVWPLSGGSALAINGDSVVFAQNVVTGHLDVPAVGNEGAGVTSSCNVFWNNPGGEADGFTLDTTDVITDPLYCSSDEGDFTVSGNSPCLPKNSNGCGLIGAWGEGCGVVSVESESWAKTKARYRGDREQGASR